MNLHDDLFQDVRFRTRRKQNNKNDRIYCTRAVYKRFRSIGPRGNRGVTAVVGEYLSSVRRIGFVLLVAIIF